jgi:hypothetical protein
MYVFITKDKKVAIYFQRYDSMLKIIGNGKKNNILEANMSDPFVILLRQLMSDRTFLKQQETVDISDRSYNIISDSEEVKIMFSGGGSISRYIFMPDIELNSILIDVNASFNDCIFVGKIRIYNVDIRANWSFDNCYFLDKVEFENFTSTQSLYFRFGAFRQIALENGRCNHIRFERITFFESFKFIYSEISGSISLLPRGDSLNILNRNEQSSIYDFSCTKFQGQVFLDFFSYNLQNPKLVLDHAEFLGAVDQNFFEELKKNKFKILIFSKEEFIKSITDELAVKVLGEENPSDPIIGKKFYQKIKNSFLTLKNYSSREYDSDKLLEVLYYFRKYEALERRWDDGSSYAFWRNIKWCSEYLFLDLLSKYFTNWKRVLLSIVITVFSFFFLFLAFANYIHDGNDIPLTQNHFYIDFSQEVDTERVLNVAYFTLVTFTTIGYGDYHPTGLLKIAAGMEGLIGIFLTSIFTVTLARKVLG